MLEQFIFNCANESHVSSSAAVCRKEIALLFYFSIGCHFCKKKTRHPCMESHTLRATYWDAFSHVTSKKNSMHFFLPPLITMKQIGGRQWNIWWWGGRVEGMKIEINPQLLVGSDTFLLFLDPLAPSLTSLLASPIPWNPSWKVVYWCKPTWRHIQIFAHCCPISPSALSFEGKGNKAGGDGASLEIQRIGKNDLGYPLTFREQRRGQK